MGMLQTSVRHSYLRSEIGVLSRFPVARMNEQFAALEHEAMAEAKEEGFDPAAVSLTRLIDLRYPHQGYTLPVACPAVVAEGDKARLKQAFDEVHAQVYGQSAPKEDAEIVTFRLQAEIEIPRLSLPELKQGDGQPERARKGTRDIFDIDAGRFVAAAIYDRALFMAGDRIAGPAIIDQFDSTTLVLAGQTATVDPTGTLVIEESEAAA
jgi:N-methylhydantoinase A